MITKMKLFYKLFGKQVFFEVQETNDYGACLVAKKIKPSYLRIKVLGYLRNHATHPTVDQIYQELVREVPTLSKTTLYNTLKLLVAAGLAQVITIEDNETRYDGNAAVHGHFKCVICRRVYDFAINTDNWEVTGLAGFQIAAKAVYFKGVCPKCLENKE
jgi:Fur family peroxide stress response transcriptional regulator